MADDPVLAPRIACFLSHLAGEKSLKACLIALGRPLRKVHDLLELRNQLPADHASRFDPGDLAILNTWLVEGRYPADLDEATPDEAAECVAAAARVLASAEGLATGGAPGSGP